MSPPDSRRDSQETRPRGTGALGVTALGDRHALGNATGKRDGDAQARDRVALADSFFAHFLRAPALVGGIVPSSRVLARALSRQAEGYDAIVELGAGGGSVTRWLARDHPRSVLTVVERDPGMARRLARSWPRARVHAGCVHEFADRLLAQPSRTVAVSSLPFRSLPADLGQATIEVIERFLLAHSARRLVQYSYGLREPFTFGTAAIRWRRAQRVWRNLPPAVVWIAEPGDRAEEA
jgi:phospholipid N-methyltransferase